MPEKLSTKEKVTLVQKLEERLLALSLSADRAKHFGIDTSPFMEEVWALQDAAIVYASALVDDQAEWLAWYFYDRRCMAARTNSIPVVTAGKKKFKVASVADIIKVIEYHNAH